MTELKTNLNALTEQLEKSKEDYGILKNENAMLKGIVI